MKIYVICRCVILEKKKSLVSLCRHSRNAGTTSIRLKYSYHGRDLVKVTRHRESDRRAIRVNFSLFR